MYQVRVIWGFYLYLAFRYWDLRCAQSWGLSPKFMLRSGYGRSFNNAYDTTTFFYDDERISVK